MGGRHGRIGLFGEYPWRDWELWRKDAIRLPRSVSKIAARAIAKDGGVGGIKTGAKN
jgi:hypothetical protein